MLISICIPTYNRPKHLLNCLNSLSKQTNKKFEVCISDNCSKEDIKKIIKPFRKKLKIKFQKNKKNLGFAVNLLKVSQMASGEFIWFLGDDDLLIPVAIEKLTKLINKNLNSDFFWINSYYLDYEFIQRFKSPFNTKNLPKNMKPHSTLKRDRKLMFFDLIDKKISFDYLLGVYVCVFRKKKWDNNLHVIDRKLIKDTSPWSNFENTHAHIKIYANAFKHSKAFFNSDPITVNLYGVREWNDLYSFIEVVRLPEILDFYRSKGLPFKSYVVNKNYSLRNFTNYFLKILFLGKKGGLNYVNFYRHIFLNLLYPNVYLSVFKFIFRKIKKILN